MKTGYYDTDELITALATPWGESALAAVRTSGNGCIEAASVCFFRPEAIAAAESGTIQHALMCDPETGEAVDEVTAAVYRAPSGYTGQDSVEIFCHGSLPGIQRILEILHAAGFRDARPGEFTLRAFINGKLDLTRAEAVQELVTAKSRKAHSLALDRLSGNLFREIDSVKQQLVELLSSIEVQLDYAEDEIAEPTAVSADHIRQLQQRTARLAETYRTGRLFAEGARVVLAGRTNSGKSSLFNLFLKEDRSIVSEIHGTTRDYIESWITVSGVPIRLFDTAGYRFAEDVIEAEGIRRSEKIAEAADLVLYLVDGNRGFEAGEIQDLQKNFKSIPTLLVWNKSDMSHKAPPAGSIAVSAVSGAGFSELETAIITGLAGKDISQETDSMIDSLRQKELLEHAAGYLAAAAASVDDGMPLDITAPELSGAIDALGEITGEITSSDILDKIFSGFCVGK